MDNKKTCRICNEYKHVEDFYPNRRVCKPCHFQNTYKWNAENQTRRLEIASESKKRNYPKHRDKILAINREWRENNPDRVKENYRKYYDENPHLYAEHRRLRDAKTRQQTPAWANKEKIKEIYKQARKDGLEVDHIIPLQGKLVSGLHVESNLQLLSGSENRKKYNTHADYHS